MICPNCKAEYKAGFTRCSDCDVDLVDRLPSQPESPGHDEFPAYVPVTTAQGQLETGQIQSFLESNGIPSEIRGESFRTVYGLVVDGLGAVDVLVPKEQAATALDLLDKADHGELAIEESSDETSTPES
jgi:hypothetical protein